MFTTFREVAGVLAPSRQNKVITAEAFEDEKLLPSNYKITTNDQIGLGYFPGPEFGFQSYGSYLFAQMV